METALEATYCATTSPGVRESYQQVDSWPGTWLIAQANPTHLQHAQEFIEDTGVAVFVPRVTRWVEHRTVRRRVLRPLFDGGYLFCCVPYPELMPDTRREWEVSKLIPVFNQDRLRDELLTVQRAIEIDSAAMAHPTLKVGTLMEVRTGPYRGMKGKIDYLHKNRLYLNMHTLGQSVSIAFDLDNLDPVGE